MARQHFVGAVRAAAAAGTTVHSIYATRTSSQSAVMGIDGTQAGIGSLMQMEKTISVLLFFPICHLIAY